MKKLRLDERHQRAKADGARNDKTTEKRRIVFGYKKKEIHFKSAHRTWPQSAQRRATEGNAMARKEGRKEKE